MVQSQRTLNIVESGVHIAQKSNMAGIRWGSGAASSAHHHRFIAQSLCVTVLVTIPDM